MKTFRCLPLLFLYLCVTELARAQAGMTTLLVKTDISCNWKLDGQAMGMIKPDDPKIALVSAGEHIVEAATTDGVATSRTKVVVEQSEKTVDIQLQSKHELQLKMKHDDSAILKAGESLGPTWTDLSTRLMWTRKDNGSNVSWNQAVEYCSMLRLGGYSDWRLPTIDELQAIYDPSVSERTKFDNGVTYNVHIKGHIKLTGWELSSTPGKKPDSRMNFVFDRPEPQPGFSGGFDFSLRALCVRQSGDME